MITLLYIDPGTGSMLFAVLISVLSAAYFSARTLWMKIKFLLNGGKKMAGDDKKIPLAIFSDDKRYWQIFEPICEELLRRGQSICYLTASADDPALEYQAENYRAEFLGKGNRAFARLNFLNARILFSTTPGLDVYQWKRSKNVDYYVHILHAANEATNYRMFGLDYYDALLLSGEYQKRDIRNLERLRGLPEKEICLVGQPYMDEMVRRLEREGAVGKNADDRTVLLAPSWGPSAIFSKYGGKIIEVLLDTGYHIIIRPHPQMFSSEKALIDGLMKKYPASERLEWNRDNDNFEVLNRADILISDFSGVIFDFALVYDKPIIYADTEFDKAPYDAWWLDTPYWTMTALPRLGEKLTPSNFAELKDLIDRCIDTPGNATKRLEVRNETWVHRGEGAKCCADYLIGKLKELEALEK